MKVELVSCTNYVGTFFGLKDLSLEELMIAIARVSSDREPEKRGENINGLLSHCYKNNHWSVFDIVDVTFYVQTSIPISMQILRHWSMRFQMFSQRYQEVSDLEPIEFREKGKTDRQASDSPANIPSFIEESIYRQLADLVATYKTLVNDYNVSKETARFILPLCSKTELFVKGSLRSWIHYLEQREDWHAQKEHRIIAEHIRTSLETIFPETFRLIKQVKSQNTK